MIICHYHVDSHANVRFETKLRYRTMFIGTSQLIQQSKNARVGKVECYSYVLLAIPYLPRINSLPAVLLRSFSP
ncbi:hypothetical protein X777_05611 [Ooceraea biroi]|uniref:Uncharacterized protein n=1 Tax=Ooceraea biroi TaxID=2015173 RepID=A0A026WFC3_OOCBI|nr:hypothetical protein X777_05611 [Ooceraea biroi]